LGEQRRELELRMVRDIGNVLELRHVRRVEFDQLVVGARQRAMGGGEHEVARDGDAGAGGAAGADQQHHMARDRRLGRRRAAHHGDRQTRRHEETNASGEAGDHAGDQPDRGGDVNRFAR